MRASFKWIIEFAGEGGSYSGYAPTLHQARKELRRAIGVVEFKGIAIARYGIVRA